MEDTKIIDLYFARNETAITETDQKYGTYCRSIAWNILQNHEDSEECVSDTWLRAWNAMPPQRPRVLRQFLAKITRNLSLDRFRADHAQKRGSGEVPLALEELKECVGSGDPATDAERKLLEELIGQFLQQLSQRDRGVFLRRYFYMESRKDIAARYGMKETNVRLCLSRTRQRLREYLRKEDFPL
jgi:RNA polymerase sigma-70 factor (ECF subfamily)